MNIIFIAIAVSAIYLLMINGTDVMPPMLSGMNNGITFSIKLFGIYAVWLSVFKIWEKLGADKKLGDMLKKPVKYLFPKENATAYSFIAMNLSANLIGAGGAGTPLGIKAIENMSSKKNKIMLLVINSTSIQLLPATIISIRADFGSTTDIILPSFIVTLFTTVIGILAVKFFVKDKKC